MTSAPDVASSPFPESPRVIYEHNPLELVVCQLRFPPILKIESEQPVAFQEEIRGKYPLYSETQAVGITVDLPEPIAKLLPVELGGRPVRQFSSEDSVWTISLSRETLSLSTQKYVRWEDFKAHFAGPLGAFERLYSPPFYSRLGLRYRNVVSRATLGLQSVPWRALLNPAIAGELSQPQVADFVEHVAREVVISLADTHGSRVRVQHGLVRILNSPDTCYVIDSDFFTDQRTNKNNANAILDLFNGHSGRLFRWCISSTLEGAMEPRPVT